MRTCPMPPVMFADAPPDADPIVSVLLASFEEWVVAPNVAAVLAICTPLR